MRTKNLFSIVGLAIGVSTAVFTPNKALALYDLYDCCQQYISIPAEYDQCEGLGAWMGTLWYFGGQGNCNLQTGYLQPAPYTYVKNAYIFTGDLTASSAVLTNLSTGSFTIATNSTGTILPVNLTLAAWNGSNVLNATRATSVAFYAVPTSVANPYIIENQLGHVPWTYVGNGIHNAKAGLWQMQWSPTNYQGYLIAADVYDPTLTTYFTNNLGVVTNGYASILASVNPAPSIARLSIPAILPFAGSLSIPAILPSIVFTVDGPTASNCVLQVSSNLKVWSNAITNTSFNGQARFFGYNTRTNQHEFYRAIFY